MTDIKRVAPHYMATPTLLQQTFFYTKKKCLHVGPNSWECVVDNVIKFPPNEHIFKGVRQRRNSLLQLCHKETFYIFHKE